MNLGHLFVLLKGFLGGQVELIPFLSEILLNDLVLLVKPGIFTGKLIVVLIELTVLRIALLAGIMKVLLLIFKLRIVVHQILDFRV